MSGSNRDHFQSIRAKLQTEGNLTVDANDDADGPMKIEQLCTGNPVSVDVAAVSNQRYAMCDKTDDAYQMTKTDSLVNTRVQPEINTIFSIENARKISDDVNNRIA